MGEGGRGWTVWKLARVGPCRCGPHGRIDLEQLINPVILFTMCALGAIGVCLALPRRGLTAQFIGATIAGLAGGVVVLALTLKNLEHHPNIFFYIFSGIALGSALRVITHPRPVYAALYFILTIVASAGLYLILAAEFMAFALIIVYAGAILITYLFVIMLASQASAEGDDSGELDYDTTAREPIAASFVAFLLLAALTALMFRGVANLGDDRAAVEASEPGAMRIHPLAKDVETRDAGVLNAMPRRLRAELRKAGVEVAEGDDIAINPGMKTVTIKPLTGMARTIALPEGVSPYNVENVGFNLLGEHPGSIEIAGVILLMAMLGAVVLSRKQVELDEEAKKAHADMLSSDQAGGAA